MSNFFVRLLSSLFTFSLIMSGSSVASAATNDTLVVYFSATGNTRAMAATISSAIGADTYEIVPQEPYSEDDLNYHNESCRANNEQRNATLRPKLKALDADLTPYKTVILAYPLWWDEEPRIVDTFVEHYDFSGKTVVPVCTSGSSDIAQSIVNLKKNIKGKPSFKEGKRFSSHVTADEFKSWYESL